MQVPQEQRVTFEQLERMSAAYAKDITQQVAQKSVMQNGILASAEDDALLKKLSPPNFAFSVDVDREAVANQKQSGRCWMFAGLNFLRWHIEKELNLPHGTFELSQAYYTFYNKLERAAWFLENIIRTAAEPLDSREVSYLLQTPMEDGGYWDWIAGLIMKYGAIPHSAMAETHASNNSSEINTVLSTLLRKDAIEMRRLSNENKDTSEAMDRMLTEVYRILATCYGEPPKTIDFQYVDKNNKYHADFGLTPKQFQEKYVPIDLNDYIAVSNFPGENRPFNRMYTIETSAQIPNRRLLYLNVPMDDLKKLVLDQLDGGNGEPVWFASDVLKGLDRVAGVMDTKLYDLSAMFGVALDGMDKGTAIDMWEAGPDHAMMIAGVDIHDGKPLKWKVENSWGTENGGQPTGHNGYYVGGDDWFNEYVYVCAIRRDLLSDEQRKILDTDPIVLPFYTSL